MSLSRRRFLGLTATFALASPILAQEKDTSVTGEKVATLTALDEVVAKFVSEQGVPGAALAAVYRGELRYARGFGVANRDTGEAVKPSMRFRIASVSKPFTATAILRLIEDGKLGLDDSVAERLEVKGKDERWRQITVRHCLQHRGGWDRELSGDPIAQPRKIAQTLKISTPVPPDKVVTYLLSRPLDFNPGERYAYANVGYLVLGRIIEKITGQPYESYVRSVILSPLKLTSMKLGRATWENREADEVRYHTASNRQGASLYSSQGEMVPFPYGAENFEAFEAHGGWIASAPDLARFADVFQNSDHCPLLKSETLKLLTARPEGLAGYDKEGKPRASYYGCGWACIPAQSYMNHSGRIAGTESLLVKRGDGWSWAVLFNTDGTRNGGSLAGSIQSRVNAALK
jgi:N-acyl-D-amino-acid deacylase